MKKTFFRTTLKKIIYKKNRYSDPNKEYRSRLA